MDELQALVASLGRRPALRGKRRRLPPTVRVPDSMREVPRIAVAAPDRPGGVEGLTTGGDLARMITSEAALLKAAGGRGRRGRQRGGGKKTEGGGEIRGRKGAEGEGARKGGALRTLFLAKLAERRLLSLEMRDFVEERAIVEPPPPNDDQRRRRRVA